jgi:hypothetical protein
VDTKLVNYRRLIKKILGHYAEIINRRPEPAKETEVVFDEERDHYILHTIGWQDTKRVWNTTVYVRLRNGKIWIEIDWLEHGITPDLLEAGVPKEDIVLAFHHPEMRPFTEFAIA